MKTIPPACPEPETGPKYWRSLEQLADTAEFRAWAEREFPAGASELKDGATRRDFVKIMSASFLLAGLGAFGTGCRRPEEKIYPFSKLPEGYTHGVAQYFATAMPNRGSAIPLVVKSHEGRPTKIEGNAQHPDSNGATDTFAQASILNLYDPDRAQRFTKGGNTVSREAALDFLVQSAGKFAQNGGQGLCFLVERSSSPSRARLQELIHQKYPQSRWAVYEPVDFDIHRRAASAAFGKPVNPYFKLDQANVIVSLDFDFVGGEEDSARLIRGWAQKRKVAKPTDTMSRLYAVESLMTLTGANADHRLRVAPSQVLAVAAQLGAEIETLLGAPAGSKLAELGGTVKQHEKWIAECAKDLVANKGKCLVVAGHRQPVEAHLIAHKINAALGNVGTTVVFQADPPAQEVAIAELAQDLKDGKVDTLVILGGNPIYNAPADLEWVKLQAQAKSVVRLGYNEDETFEAAKRVNDWHLQQAHYLESWGDARTSDGTVVPVQPLIEPLFGGVTEIEVLARLAGLDATKPYEVVRETFKSLAPAGDFEASWKKFLHDGFLADSAHKAVAVAFYTEAANKIVEAATVASAPTKEKLEVVFHRDYSVDDGRYNNNGWLQELPDPITKMVWENVILISPQTAKDLGLDLKNHENNNLQVPWVKLDLNGRSVEGPVWLSPGQADFTLGLALGYGRKQTGRIGRGSGFDAYRLRTASASNFASGAKLNPAARTYQISCTQDHWSMEGRPIIREANLEEYRQHPNFAKGMNMPDPPSSQPLYPNPLDQLKQKPNVLHQWGMSIDLGSCVGCSACMIACQSENNIPIVGKEQVYRNREMHWIRIDRYFTGDTANPQMINQPMMCLHCESAPCESVCPVNATVHDEEGLNVMVYNRCVGTRYCSNNCPYKVRRFNFFDYNRRPLDQLAGPFYPTPMTHTTDGKLDVLRWWKDPDRGNKPSDEWDLLKLVKNPDVSVRMRGVMEKCTYCVQRIEGAKIAQKVKAGASGDVRLTDQAHTTPKTACQQACPAEAIVFGDVSDPESQVSKLKALPRNYTVLEFLATKPRTTYLARIRNPNPAMPDYADAPFSSQEFAAKNGHHSAEHEAPADARKGAH